jgi:formate dehydrogenase iron-sulfur subunit
LQLAGNIKRGGLIERAFGLTLRELIYEYGGGSANGRPIRAVQVGGPLGAYVPASQFDTAIDYEALSGIGALLGHGGVVAFDDTVDMAGMARYAMEFCAKESCGKCTPCRIGSTRGVELMDRVMANIDRERNLQLICTDPCSYAKTGEENKHKARGDRLLARHLGVESPSREKYRRESQYRRKMNGTVVMRLTGEVVCPKPKTPHS